MRKPLVHDDVDKIVDIHNAKPRSPLKKRKSILVSESSVENRIDEKKVDFTNAPVDTELHRQNRAIDELLSYQINVLSVAGLKIATKTYAFIDINGAPIHQTKLCDKNTSSPEWNNTF